MIAMGVILLAWLAPLPLDVYRNLWSGTGVIGIDSENIINGRLRSVTRVSQEIDNRTVPGEQVLSIWPGYLVQSHAGALPGTESDVGFFITPRLSDADVRRFGLLKESDVAAGFARSYPCLVVLGNSNMTESEHFESLARMYGYRPVFTLGHTDIYSCKK
jgi:hypothetical protein